MTRWVYFTVLVILISTRTTNLKTDDTCQIHQSVLNWPQLTCTNIDSNFFRNFKTPLNRTHWIRCANCSLTIIDEKTFNFSRNNVSFLELPECKVKSVKRFAFSSFFLLKILNLRRNEIDYLEPKCFAGLKRLWHLDLSSNLLRILTNNVFSDLPNLDVLNLTQNQIFYVQPYAFADLINLKYLYINNNDLKKLEDRMFKHLSNLKLLYIERNNIIEIHQNAFIGLKNLNYLYLNHNSISFLVQYNFKPLTSLFNLQLRFNNLSEIQVSSFNGLKNLRYLYLGDNHISLIKPYGLIGLDSLVVLELVRNNFSSIDFSYFDKLPKLYILWLNENYISNFIINSENEVQNSLAVVDLSFNKLANFNYTILHKKMPNIKEIVFANNSHSCDFLTDLYRFYLLKNISLCLTTSCRPNETNFYIDTICLESFESTIEPIYNITDDYSTAFAPTFGISVWFYTALFFIVFLHCY
ncbi:insulin-like growth factor-binding protein complex acid labile subunit [Anthonomus grandis grandis]|uniref:insulin-like growth factor-binding protein complex acid labile subunit n=1 Tax=Anthonomus grandis grandis TaxID=2921223 RepID=UPI0021657E68|nr:insulin-like growth factor-binding protein complex acid labile subunit [Anthonomus grandis grandis]